MVAEGVRIVNVAVPELVRDSVVGKGYRQGDSGSLPDVDIDFQSDRRQEVKEYLERRYNHNGLQRVFSAGTFTTLKLKAVLKDVARVYGVPVSEVNYINAIIEDDSLDWCGFFQLVHSKRRLKEFVQRYPQVIESIRTLMGQPRSSSVHASAIIITPDHKDGKTMECFDYLPIKKVDGMLVSEIDGYSIDEIGLLKNDCLGIKELERIQNTRSLVVQNYHDETTFLEIINDKLNDEKAYDLFVKGYTQNIFQFSSVGMTKFVMLMKPNCINDLIAANALFRPATIETGATEAYVKCKHGEVAPEYLWGTYEIMKETFGQLCIAEDSNVVTSDGLKKIQDVKAGDMVLTEDGTYQKVIATRCNGIKQAITVHGTFGEELICTPDHKVLTQFGWVEAKDLIPKYHLIKSFWCVPECREIGTIQDWCLGIYLANGHYDSTPTITCRNKEEAELTAQIFNKAFGLDSILYFHTRAWYISLRQKAKSNKTNPFKQFLDQRGLAKKRSTEKFVPFDHCSLMLLAGIVEGDGCMLNGVIRLVNKYMAWQIFIGFQSHRIISSLHQTFEKGQLVNNVHFNDNVDKKLPLQFKTHYSKGKHETWRGFQVPIAYARTIDLKKLEKSQKAAIQQSMLRVKSIHASRIEAYGGVVEHREWSKVLSLNPGGMRNVYDLTIENNHSFCVGGLIVHNCYQEELAAIAQRVGGFSLVEGVHLVKYISKKKVDKIQKMKDKFMEGAAKKGCPDDQAKAIWAMFEAGGSYLFNKCISGKEHLMNIRKEPSFLSIEQMYKLRHNIPCDVPDMYKHFNAMFDVLGHYGVTISMNKDYRCYCNTIQDIQYSGHRELFRITLENGSTIDVTSNHKHPTQDGIKHTDELQVGVDSMYVVEDSSDRRNYGFVLCKIISIESIGMEDVYDVTMADPYHNFVTGNGVVTCNSHATAYALTAYIGAWYKANYPTAFYTVALKYAKDENISTLMYEMDKASNCRVVPPDINKSGEEFITNFQTNEIYWSLTRIKFVGVETVRLIIEEREKRGPFRSFGNFCDRIKTAKIEKSESEEGGRFPFTSRHIKNLIFAGCFDRIEYIENICQRYRLLQTAIRYFEFELDEELFAPHKINLEYFWSSLQIQACGIGSIDYRKAFDESIYKPSYKGKTYRNIEDCRDLALDGKRTVVCATIADMVEKTYTDKSTMDKKSFLKLTLQQNNDTIEMTVWQEDLDKYRDLFVNCVGRIIIAYAIIKFSDFSNANTLQVFKSSIINML